MKHQNTDPNCPLGKEEKQRRLDALEAYLANTHADAPLSTIAQALRHYLDADNIASKESSK